MTTAKITVVKHRLGYAIALPNVWAADVLVTDDEARDLTNALLAARDDRALPMPCPAWCGLKRGHNGSCVLGEPGATEASGPGSGVSEVEHLRAILVHVLCDVDEWKAEQEGAAGTLYRIESRIRKELHRPEASPFTSAVKP